MDQMQASTGYALIDPNGSIVAMDDVFRGWLAGRDLVELLPEFSLNGDAEPGRQMSVRFVGREPMPIDVEVKRLTGAGGVSVLLRIETAASSGEFDYRDVVTGLPDRRALATHRLRLLGDAEGALPHALLFLDLDNFKQVNDSLGHAIGDRVLAILAERWRKSLRRCDLIVRYGGDEFVVLLAGVRSHADVEPIVARLQAATTTPLEIAGHTMTMSVAIGVALADDGTVTLGTLLDEADKAMYAAKRRNS